MNRRSDILTRYSKKKVEQVHDELLPDALLNKFALFFGGVMIGSVAMFLVILFLNS